MRFRITLAYHGKKYVGWQRQPNGISVQEKLEEALTVLNGGIRVAVTGAGRTDAGVHAENQVAHFDFDKKMESEELGKALNGILPNDILIKSCQAVKNDFHSRYDAKMRIYQYRVCSEPDPLLAERYWIVKYPLDSNLLVIMAKLLVGEYDFRFFSKRTEEIENTICRIFYTQWIIKDCRLIFEVGANRFIRSMVRMLVGVMIETARGRLSLDDFEIMLKEPAKSGFTPLTAPAHGLTLKSVLYKEDFDENFY